MSDMATTDSGGVPTFELRHRLALALEHADVSVADMADVIGYSVKQTSNYLHGRQHPREGTLRVWAIRCGVPLVWLRDGIVPDDGPGGTSDLRSDRSSCTSHTADVIQLRAS